MSVVSILFHLQSFCILCVLGVGILLRRRRRWHVSLMLGAMVWDIVLILQIELFRDAIFKASRFMENSPLLNVHITLAVITLFFYGASLYTGKRLLAHDFSARKLHRRVGVGAFSLRILTFVTGLLNALNKGVSP